MNRENVLSLVVAAIGLLTALVSLATAVIDKMF